MANVDINIKVHNLESLKALKDRVAGVDKSTKMSNASLAKWGVTLASVTIAVQKVWKASRDYQEELNRINKTTDELTASNKRAEAQFKKTSYAITESAKAQQAFNLANEVYISFLEDIEMLWSGKSRRQIKIEALLHKGALERLDDAKKIKKEMEAQNDLQDRANKLWYKSEKADEVKRIAEAEAEGYLAMMKYNDGLDAQNKLLLANERALKLQERANKQWRESEAEDAKANNKLSKQSFDKNPNLRNNFGKENYHTDMGFEAQESNTEAIKENTDILKTSWQWEVKGQTRMDAIRRNQLYNKAGASNYSTELMNSNYLKQLIARDKSNNSGHSFTGTMQAPEDRRQKMLEESIRRLTREQKARLNLIDVLELEQKDRLALIDELQSKQEQELGYIDDYIKSMQKAITALDQISNLLSNDFYSRAREALFGGTKSGLTFGEAKGNAQKAWDAFQADNQNTDLLLAYNQRMDELIGTLDEFKDWTRYDSKAQQTFAKHKALRDVKDFQEAQDTEKTEVDQQLAELKLIKANTQTTYEKLYNVINGINTTNANTSKTVSELAKSILEMQKVKDNTKTTYDKTQGVINNTKTTYDKVSALIVKQQATLTKIKSNDRGTDIKAISSTKVKTGESFKPYKATGGVLSYKMMSDYAYETKATMGNVNRTGYRDGGYTGNMGVNSVAGQVHGQEYVLNASTTKNLGLNNDSGGVFTEMAQLMYEQLKVTKRMHSVEKQMLKLQELEVAS